ncbi:MAG: universal stress protein [Pseudomonadota bacterium]
MFKTIMVPVDLEHTEALQTAFSVTGQLADLYGAKVIFVGVSGTFPSAVSKDAQEFRTKLEALAQSQRFAQISEVSAKPIFTHDPSVDLAPALIQAAEQYGADLVIMASHVPGFAEHLISSNAGYVASHAPMSVFVVR